MTFGPYGGGIVSLRSREFESIERGLNTMIRSLILALALLLSMVSPALALDEVTYDTCQGACEWGFPE